MHREMTAGCSDENELMELADGLLPMPRHAKVMRHVDECVRCRATLAELVRSSDAFAETAQPPPLASEDPRPQLPVEFLREYLKQDAPVRELQVARFVAALMVGLIAVTLVKALFGSHDFVLRALVILVAVLGYEVVCIYLLRRGWFHPGLPLASSLVEVSAVFAVQLVTARMSSFSYLAFPGAILLGVLVVFSALRADPRLCVIVGAIAGVGVLGFGLFGPPVTTASGSTTMLGVHIIRAIFCFIGGLAGMSLARNLIGRAEAALREIREQDLFGKYLVHERLGQGGMGEVSRATYCPEGGFVRTVAVKRVRPELSRDSQFIDSFRREVQLGATLVHPNLVQMLDCGRFRGAYVVVMEFVDGASLATVLSRLSAPLPLAAVTYLGAELAAALAYLHSKRARDGAPLGLVHCDLNPPNVLLSRIGEVKLADFGVARAGSPVGRQVRFAGKINYAAPEQLRGEGIDGRADLFALGLTLHEALTGRPAIPPASSALHATIARPSLVRRDVSPALDSLLMELIARSPAERSPDASQIRTRLSALEGACAPYPHGERLLAQAVESALGDAEQHADSRSTSEPRGAAVLEVATRRL